MKQKNEPWRILVALASVAYIVFLWVRKGISAAPSLPEGAVFPLIATTAAVTLGKVALLAAAVFLIRWIVRKLRNK